MKTAYKIRQKGTDANPWMIAVIYDYGRWAERNLLSKALIEPQIVREATQDEIKEAKEHTRLLVYFYDNITTFLEDEKTFKVPTEYTDLAFNILKRKQNLYASHI